MENTPATVNQVIGRMLGFLEGLEKGMEMFPTLGIEYYQKAISEFRAEIEPQTDTAIRLMHEQKIEAIIDTQLSIRKALEAEVGK